MLNSANTIIANYLKNCTTLLEITDVVHAMMTAVDEKGEIKRTERGRLKKGKSKNRKAEETNKTKELRSLIAKAGNELNRRRIKRKATKRSKVI